MVKEKCCMGCRIKEELLSVDIGDFIGVLCPRCYIIKMLETICKKLEINVGFFVWLKKKNWK